MGAASLPSGFRAVGTCHRHVGDRSRHLHDRSPKCPKCVMLERCTREKEGSWKSQLWDLLPGSEPAGVGRHCGGHRQLPSRLGGRSALASPILHARHHPEGLEQTPGMITAIPDSSKGKGRRGDEAHHGACARRWAGSGCLAECAGDVLWCGIGTYDPSGP